jgi:two-component system sensor histidine kinase ChiS
MDPKITFFRIVITLSITFFISFYLNAQPWDPLNPPQFQHISVNDGLSDSRITSIVQDHKGFMWFGTHEGLNRYDGYEFKIFKHDPKDSTSIPSDFIHSLTILKDSSLWVGTNNGMVGKFDRSSNTFTRYKIYPADNGPVYVTDIYEHSNGLLYIGTSSGLFVFDRKNNQVDEFNFTEIEDPTSKRVRTIYADEFGNLIVGTEYSPGGLFFLDLENKRSYQFTSSSPYTDKEILNVF